MTKYGTTKDKDYKNMTFYCVVQKIFLWISAKSKKQNTRNSKYAYCGCFNNSEKFCNSVVLPVECIVPVLFYFDTSDRTWDTPEPLFFVAYFHSVRHA